MRSDITKPVNAADFAVWALLVGFGVCQLGFYQRIESFAADSSIYIGLARSLIEKGSYEFNFKPHTLFPPGLATMFALISMVFGGSYSVFVRSMAVFGALALVAAYELLRREQGRAAAAAACLLLGSSPYFFAMATRRIGSDLPFFLSSMLTLFFATKVGIARSPRARWLWWVGFVFLLLSCLMIRSVGVALLGGMSAWIAFSFFGERRSATARLRVFVPALTLGIVVQVLWMGWTQKVEIKDWPDEYFNSYSNQFWMRDPHRPELGVVSSTDFLFRASENVVRQGAYLSELISRKQWIDPLWYSPLVLVPMVLVLLGLAVSIRRGGGQYLEWYFVSYVAVYSLWPFDEGARFILPAFPLAFLYLWRGAEWLTRIASERLQRVPVYGFPLSVALCAGSVTCVFWGGVSAGVQATLSVIFWAALAIVLGMLRRRGVGELGERLFQSSLYRGTVVVLRGRQLTVPHAIGLTALGILIFVGLAMEFGIAAENLAAEPSKYRHYPSVDAAEWIESQTASNDTVMAGQAAIVHRISGRKVIDFPVSSDATLIMKVIREHNVAFLLVVRPDKYPYLSITEEERFRSLSRNYPEAFRAVHRGVGYQILRISTQSVDPPAD